MADKKKKRLSLFSNSGSKPTLDYGPKRPRSPASYDSVGKPVERRKSVIGKLFSRKKSSSSEKKMYMLGDESSSIAIEPTGSLTFMPGSLDRSLSDLRPRDLFHRIKEKISSRMVSDAGLSKSVSLRELNPEPIQVTEHNTSSALSLTTHVECTVAHDNRQFGCMVILGGDDLQIQGHEETDSFSLSFEMIVEIHAEERTLIIIKMKDGFEFLMSQFTIDFEKAYYSLMVSYNHFIDTMGRTQVSKIDCDCGHRHKGVSLLNTELSGTIPVAIYKSLLTQGRYFLWKSPIENGFVIDELFNDLDEQRSIDTTVKILDSSADRYLVSISFVTFVKSYDYRVKWSILLCCIRPDPTAEIVLFNAYYEPAEYQYLGLKDRLEAQVLPSIRERLVDSLERLQHELEDDEIEVDLIETCPSCPILWTRMILFAAMPLISELRGQIVHFRLYKVKEALLASIIMTIVLLYTKRFIKEKNVLIYNVGDFNSDYWMAYQYKQERLMERLQQRIDWINQRMQ